MGIEDYLWFYCVITTAVLGISVGLIVVMMAVSRV